MWLPEAFGERPCIAGEEQMYSVLEAELTRYSLCGLICQIISVSLSLSLPSSLPVSLSVYVCLPVCLLLFLWSASFEQEVF